MNMKNLAFLAQEVPGFAVKGENIVVLTEPNEYYKELCRLASNVKQRSIFAALYLGTGSKEQALVESVQKSLEKTNGGVKVRFLLDYCRGTRDVKEQSSCTKLLPLVEKYKVSKWLTLFLYIVVYARSNLHCPHFLSTRY